MSPAERQRLVAVLGMLGSDHDGERATAGRMAHDMLRKLGATWDQVVAPIGLPPIIAANEDHRTLAARLMQRSAMLDPAERAFLTSIAAWRKISPKQARWLSEIAQKVAAAEQGA